MKKALEKKLMLLQPAKLFGRLAVLILVLGLLSGPNAWLGPNVSAQEFSSSSDPLTLDLVQTDNSAGGAALDGFITNDLLANTEGRLVGFQLALILEEGSIYQDPYGSNLPPTQLAVESLVPSLAYDTFLAMGSPYANGNYGITGPFGKAVNVEPFGLENFAPYGRGESGAPVMSEKAVNTAWSTAPGEEVKDVENFLLSRLTLSDDAKGHWTFLSSVSTREGLFHATVGKDFSHGLAEGMGVIEDGVMDFTSDLHFISFDSWGRRNPEPPKSEPPKIERPKTKPPKTEPPKTKLPRPEPPRFEPQQIELPTNVIDLPTNGELYLIDIVTYPVLRIPEIVFLVDSLVDFDRVIYDAEDGLSQQNLFAQANNKIPEPTSCVLTLSALALIFVQRQHFQRQRGTPWCL